jgi:hypothetical protein
MSRLLPPHRSKTSRPRSETFTINSTPQTDPWILSRTSVQISSNGWLNRPQNFRTCRPNSRPPGPHMRLKRSYSPHSASGTPTRMRISARPVKSLITAESDVSALRLEKNEVQNALLRDKEEVRGLQKKMAAAGPRSRPSRLRLKRPRRMRNNRRDFGHC